MVERLRIGPTRERIAAAIVGAACVAFVVVIGSTFWPGLMSRDSFVHYRQGMTGEYTNIFPPLGSLMLGGSGRLFGTPGPVFIAQLTAIACAFFALARGAAKSGAWVSSTIMAVFALLTPHIWSLANTLWKDIFMGAALLVAVALLQRRRWRLAFACIVLATMFRHNALLAGAPLLLYGSIRAYAGWRARLAAFAITGVTLVVSPKLVEIAVGAKDGWPAGAIAAYDLGGVLTKDRALFRRSPISHFATFRQLTRRFKNCKPQRIVSDGIGIRGMQYSDLVENRALIEQEWTRVVRARPDLYLEHRLNTFKCATGWESPEEVIMHISTGKPNDDGLTWKHRTPRYRWLIEKRRALYEANLMLVPYQWCLALLVLGCIAVRLKRWLGVATALSGLLSAAGYFLSSASAELRYYFWDILAVWAVVLLLLERAAPTTSLVGAVRAFLQRITRVGAVRAFLQRITRSASKKAPAEDALRGKQDSHSNERTD